MEERYDIRFNRAEPSSEKIATHQDFESLMASFESSSTQDEAKVITMHTTRRSYWAVAAAIALLVAAYPIYTSFNQPSFVDEATFFAERPFVDPPKTANVPDLIAKVVDNPDTDQEIDLYNGNIVLSSTALFRDRGRSIEEPVQIHYRQLDDVADYFMAGLPLQYSHNNTTTQLDAAVILDIHATAAGKSVEIAAGQLVDIELNTNINNNGNGYGIYKLDTANRQWINVGELKSQQIAATDNWPKDMPEVKRYRELESQYDRQIAIAERNANSNQQLPERPSPPQRKIGKNPTLELDFLNQISLAAGSTVKPQDLSKINKGGIWELLPETGNLDFRAFNVEWSSVRLIQLQNEKYELTLINPQKQERLIIRPIMLDDGDFFKAQQRYEAELSIYEAAVLNASSGTEDESVTALRVEKENALKALQQQIIANVNAMPLVEQQRLMHRRANFKFAISNWGIYAVARQIQDLPELTQLSFDNQPAIDNQQNAKVYYTDGKHKTLYQALIRDDNSKLPVDKQQHSSARIWIVNEQGDLVMANASEHIISAMEGRMSIPTQKAQSLPNSAELFKQKLVLE